MLQILYGWKGIPNGDGTYEYVHLPEETYQNQYEPWKNDENKYLGHIHKPVNTITTTTITKLNEQVLAEHASHVHLCTVCGQNSKDDWA